MDNHEEPKSQVGSPLFGDLFLSPEPPSALPINSPEEDRLVESDASDLLEESLSSLPTVFHYNGRAADPLGMFTKSVCSGSESPESYSPKRKRSTFEKEGGSSAQLIYELRVRREDAFFNQHFPTAEHICKELVMLTGQFEDSFRLAQIYFTMGSYQQAIKVLKTQRYLNSGKCRILASRCYIELGNLEKALEMVEENNPFPPGFFNPEDIGDDIKIVATACAVRGKIFAMLGEFEKAKENFVLAFSYDPRCYDALDGLIKNHLLEPSEEDQYIANDGSPTSEFLAASFKLKVCHSPAAEEVLTSKFGMRSHWGALMWSAKDYYEKGLIIDSYKTLHKLLKLDPTNCDCLPLYINVLVELELTHELIEFSKVLKKSHSSEAISLYADAVIEITEGRLVPAAALVWDLISNFPVFAPGWMAFGHFCTRKNYIPRALKAYATAARLMPSDYEPLLILGQHYRKLSNMQTAQEHLEKAQSLASCPNPIILNELGMLEYQKKDFLSATRLFKQGLKVVAEHVPHSILIGQRSSLKESLWVNLGHAHRNLCNYPTAETCFQNAIQVNSLSAPALAGLAMVSHGLNSIYTAIKYYHMSLRYDPCNAGVQFLLNFALEQTQDLNAHITVECSISSSDVDPPPNYFTTARRRRNNVVPYSLALDIRSEAEISNQNILSDTDNSLPNLRPNTETDP
ncbi:anaphase-promoting complex subunit Cut9 [Entomophthora muscae]|uniref:Anaphase-promoting complex subunit Cut9 n=1 Tax=Entomophthora muscae TaxID=34485 RepID=A0ACC2U6F5_9FUNG|nr:anaphase-promoting complex subunit Cut9 [Entomophthora muscae]